MKGKHSTESLCAPSFFLFLALQHVGSQFPDQGSNLCTLHCSLNHWTAREVPNCAILGWLPHMTLLFSSVQSLNCVRLFATPRTAARRASLSITNSQSPPKPMSIKSVMPSNHLILCHPLLLLPSIFPSIRVFPNESLFTSGGQNIGVSASASVLPMNTQD